MLKGVVKWLFFPTVADAAQTPADRWALALGAMYARVHGDLFFRLKTGCDLLSSTTMLRDSWGMGPKSKATDVLDWLTHEGHRGNPEFAAPGDREAAQDLLAWDMARCVFVTRHAFNAEKISKAEAWSYARGAALLAQPSYPSWEEYGRRYLRGRARWNGEREKRIDDAVDFLMEHPKSPWRQLDWQTPLAWSDGETPAAAR